MPSTPHRNRSRTAQTPSSERKRLDGLWDNNQWWCNCEPRRKAAFRQVKKESKNKGRFFFTCAATPQCDFFLWQDLANIRQPGSGTPATAQQAGNTNANTITSAQIPSPSKQPQPVTPSKRKHTAALDDDDDDEFSDLGSDDEAQLVAITERSVSQASRQQDVFASQPQTQTQTQTQTQRETQSQSQTQAQTPQNTRTIDAATGLPTPSIARNLFPAGERTGATPLTDSPSTPSASTDDTTEAQVMQLLRRTTVSDEVLSEVQALLVTAERKMQGLAKGRDAVRGALREKDMRIAELQERVVELENRGFMQEGIIREMKAKHKI